MTLSRYRVDLPIAIAKVFDDKAKEAGVSTPTILKLALVNDAKKQNIFEREKF